MKLRNKKWGIRNSALYFGISVGSVSEAIKLCKFFEKVKHLPSREKALKAIK